MMRVLTLLPKCRRAKSRTTTTTALAHMPVTLVKSPTNTAANGGVGGGGNASEACNTFSSVTKSTSLLVLFILSTANESHTSHLEWFSNVKHCYAAIFVGCALFAVG